MCFTSATLSIPESSKTNSIFTIQSGSVACFCSSCPVLVLPQILILWLLLCLYALHLSLFGYGNSQICFLHLLKYHFFYYQHVFSSAMYMWYIDVLWCFNLCMLLVESFIFCLIAFLFNVLLIVYTIMFLEIHSFSLIPESLSPPPNFFFLRVISFVAITRASLMHPTLNLWSRLSSCICFSFNLQIDMCWLSSWNQL